MLSVIFGYFYTTRPVAVVLCRYLDSLCEDFGWAVPLCEAVQLFPAVPALRRGAGRAFVKHFGMEITIYNCNTSAFLSTEDKKEGRNLSLPPGRSSYLIPEDCFSVCAIFVAGSAVCKRANNAENLREIHYKSRKPKVEWGHGKQTTTCFAASEFDLRLRSPTSRMAPELRDSWAGANSLDTEVC